jgi:hypothetical protein
VDLLVELKRKVAEIQSAEWKEGFEFTVRHIEVAEQYFRLAQGDQNANYFNDVVYRTNQAFEGILEEAYFVLEGTRAMRLTPNELEKYFLDNQRLTLRTSSLFKNYRQQWRNPSTHDHKLLFSEQEAFLALVNVSSFAVVLLDELVATMSYKWHRAQALLRQEALRVKESNDPLIEQIVHSLRSFGELSISYGVQARDDAEFAGRIGGFLVGVYPGIDVAQGVQLRDGERDYHLDLFLRLGEEDVVVVVKRGQLGIPFVVWAVTYTGDCIRAANMSSGILYVWWPDHAPNLFSKVGVQAGEVYVLGVNT